MRTEPSLADLEAHALELVAGLEQVKQTERVQEVAGLARALQAEISELRRLTQDDVPRDLMGRPLRCQGPLCAAPLVHGDRRGRSRDYCSAACSQRARTARWRRSRLPSPRLGPAMP